MGNEFLIGIDGYMYKRYLEVIGLLVHFEKMGICRFHFDPVDVPNEAHSIIVKWEASKGAFTMDTPSVRQIIEGTEDVLFNGTEWMLSYQVYRYGSVA